MSIHQLKVTLDTITPLIWRRVHVRSETTLAELHRVLQAAMGWEDYHLHAFEVGWDRYGDGEGRDETAVTVGGILPKEGGRMGYRYDFGDCWDHIIEVEKIHRPHPGTTYPRCSAGRRACPRYVAGLRTSRRRIRNRLTFCQDKGRGFDWSANFIRLWRGRSSGVDRPRSGCVQALP